METNQLIPDHQFSFRQNHSTIEQIHRLVEKINATFEPKKYCSAAFLDISQAFDRVWHEGLLHKIKQKLPINFYEFIKSYLNDRHFFVKQREEVTSLHKIQAGVPQGSVMNPILYLIYTSDLPITDSVIIGTFADDTAALATDENATTASSKLQRSLDRITQWLKDWRIKANEAKSIQITFTIRHDICPPVKLNGIQIPQANEAKYLGLYLDRRLTWRKHVFTKRKAMGIQLRRLYWLMCRKSQLFLESKLLLYKYILKLIWTYGVQLWGTTANSNIEILQRFQSKILHMTVDSPWYVTNNRLHHDLNIPTVKEEIKIRSVTYKTRLQNHPNKLASQLMKPKKIFVR